MSDEPFDEVVISARRGTMFIRGGCGRRGTMFIRGVSQTTEDENDDGSPVVRMEPVRCGHGIDHDEYCARCAAS